MNEWPIIIDSRYQNHVLILVVYFYNKNLIGYIIYKEKIFISQGFGGWEEQGQGISRLESALCAYKVVSWILPPPVGGILHAHTAEAQKGGTYPLTQMSPACPASQTIAFMIRDEFCRNQNYSIADADIFGGPLTYPSHICLYPSSHLNLPLPMTF